MKNNLFRSVIIISIISFLVTPAFAFTEGNPLTVDLVAGQNQNAGSIKAWDDGESLFVFYETGDSWCLTETHLAVASSLDGIPQANGNPIPGQFPYKNTHKCIKSFLYTVSLGESVCEIYIAAHAVVKSPGSTETAWGSGLDFPGNNWGTYFTYKSNACIDTPPVCQPEVVIADFSQIAVGQSVEGMGAVVPDLNIDAIGTAVKIEEGVEPFAYSAGEGNAIKNGGIGTGGFSDKTTQATNSAHFYTFTFSQGISVSNFSLHMVDFGDFNPTLSSPVYASMKAYNANGLVVAEQELTYTFVKGYTSPEFGDLHLTGDALGALTGQPGNWNWNVSASGISKITLEFGAGFDPKIGFNELTFTKECQ